MKIVRVVKRRRNNPKERENGNLFKQKATRNLEFNQKSIEIHVSLCRFDVNYFTITSEKVRKGVIRN